MTFLLRPVTKTKCSMPASRASSTTIWMTGLSTMVSISLGTALVAGKKRVPRPATGKTAFLIRRCIMNYSLLDQFLLRHAARHILVAIGSNGEVGAFGGEAAWRFW